MSGVHLIAEGPVAEIRLDNPAKLNAFTAEMVAALADHCATIEHMEAVRAVVVTAEDSRAFCAGADVGAWGGLSPAAFSRYWVREGHAAFDRLARLRVPTVAALSGHAFGGGLELAAACDIRVIAPGAQIALPEAGIGVVPGWSGTHRLARLIPEPILKEMVLFGRRIDAERAVAAGFAAEIADDPRARARTIASDAAALSPRAVEAAKWMVHAAVAEDVGASVEALAAGLIGASDDRKEGVAAFRARRKPAFPGS